MITNRIYDWARTQPAKTAMIHNDHPCSYAVFARAIEVTKTFFKDQRLPAGRTAIVRISNSADAWIVVLGLRSIGLTTICVNSLATAKALNIKDVACIVIAEADKAAHQREEQIWLGAPVIVVPRAIYANIHAGDVPRPMNDSPPFGGHIVYTSGTTGSYKKILKDGATEERRNSYRANFESLGNNTVCFLANFALWTNMPLIVSPAIWHAGGCIVLNQLPETFPRSFRSGITHARLTPLMLKSLLELSDTSANSVGDFELRISGGFLPLDLAMQARDRLTRNVEIGYAGTEHSSRMSSKFETIDDLHWLSPVEGSTFEIVDHNGETCAINREGELRVLLRDIDAISYLDDEEASRKFFRQGYFYPGDMAVRRADGRIRILGRVADVLNLQGEKIAAGPIEQRIQDLLGVSTACLFSFLNDNGKEELVVAIEAAKAPPQSQLDKISQEFKSFERVRFEVLQEFPRTEAGMQKIKRAELKHMIIDKIAGR
jgi:acyl-coenzyme A synthetase/AMP-(fatty) acid ligase